MVLVSVLFSLVSFLALEATGRSILIDRQLVPPICKKTLIAYDGATCQILADLSGITVEQFKLYNPTVTDCHRLSIGTPYCVQLFPDESNLKPTPITTNSPTPAPSTIPPTPVTPVPPPGPTQPGAIRTCSRWTLVLPGDTCLSIINAFNYTISSADLRAWNPTIGRLCENLWANFYLCTAAAAPPEPEPSPEPEPEKPGPPRPRQPGQPANCNRWHLAREGENCYTLVREYGMLLEEVLAWNPGFGRLCENVWAGWWACVGVERNS